MASSATTFDVAAIRADFPALHQLVHGQPLVYLDNAATTQKPRSVLDAIRHYYEHDNANVHRGVHALSERATDAYEAARETVRAFVNAASVREIVFTRNATEAINLVARAWGDANVRAGDEVLITAMEHHSNIVPWQLLCARTGARAARRADRRSRRSRDGRVRAAADADGRRWSRSSTCRTRSARSIRSTRSCAGARRRRGGAHRRIAGGVSHADRRAGARRRLLRLHRPQGLRPDRHRRALRAGSGARGDAAVPRRRRHDSHGDVRGQHLERPAVQVRGRHAEHRRRDRPGRAIDYVQGVGFDADRGARGGAAREGHRRARAPSTACASSARRAQKAASSRS